MDDRLEKALDTAAYRTTLNNQKRNLKARADVVRQIVFGGGSFTADKETINFAAIMLKETDGAYVILDNHEKPILIQKKQEFFDQLINAYNTSMDEYHRQYQKLIRSRNIKKLIGEQ